MANGVIIDRDKAKILWKKPFSFFMREEITNINKKDVIVSSITSTPAPPVGLEPTTNWLTANCSTD